MSVVMLCSWAGASVVVAWAGPFGTFESQTFAWRLGYWGVVIAAGIVFSVTLRTMWRAVLKGRPTWQEDGAVVLSLAAVFSPMIVTLNGYVGGDTARDAMGVPAVAAGVIAIASCVIAVRRTMEARARAHLSDTQGAQPKAEQRDRLFNRLPQGTPGKLGHIQSDNHHIVVRTQDGVQYRVLMRLRDAVAEVDVEPGFCVHRSHWVARDMIARVVREGAREMVEMTCGHRVPVGPKYRVNLVKAGVIND